MRHPEPKSISTKEGREILEKILLERKMSVYNLALEIGVSETSLRRYKNGLEQGVRINSHISASLKALCPPTLMPS